MPFRIIRSRKGTDVPKLHPDHVRPVLTEALGHRARRAGSDGTGVVQAFRQAQTTAIDGRRNRYRPERTRRVATRGFADR